MSLVLDALNRVLVCSWMNKRNIQICQFPSTDTVALKLVDGQGHLVDCAFGFGKHKSDTSERSSKYLCVFTTDSDTLRIVHR